jgi:uncharacterized protein (TIGR03083 family)
MEIWEAIREERLDICERLAGLTVEQWDSRSLCTDWRIRDVIGHLTAGARGLYGVGAVTRGMIRHGFNFNRWMAADGRERGRQDPSTTLEALREAAGNRKTPPGAPNVSVLTDTLIHAQDVYRPLAIHRDVPESHLRPVADFVKTTFVFGAKKRIAGLRLKATDMEWIQGDGPEVTGPAESLVMVMAGRLAALDDLTGDGKATLAGRYS